MSKWQKLWQPSKTKWLLFLPTGAILAAVVGAAALGAFNFTIHYTNQNEFCYGCHIGMDSIVEEYEASSHFDNGTGVKATCANCHVPKEFIPKMKVKIAATADIYHKLTGKITPENFESHRLDMAVHIWDDLKENDSKACRTCHDPERWDTSEQSIKAQMQHVVEFWEENNKTCINCHKGVAHLLPLRPGSLSHTTASTDEGQ